MKLIDFGAAYLIEGNFHKNPQIQGTPGYIAPETLLGRPPSSKSDIFSVGAIIFNCLTHANLWHARKAGDMMALN